MGYEFYTPRAAAVELGVSQGAVWFWIRDRRIKAVEVKSVGKRRNYVIPADAIELMRSERVEYPVNSNGVIRRPGGRRMLTDSQEIEICDEFEGGNVTKLALGAKYGVSGNTIANVLRRRGYSLRRGARR